MMDQSYGNFWQCLQTLQIASSDNADGSHTLSFICVDNLAQDLRQPTALFSADPTYSFEREYTALYDNTLLIGQDLQSCLAQNGGQQCQLVAQQEEANLIRLFSLEKNTRVLFDSLYQAEMSLLDSYRAFKASSSPSDFQNIEAGLAQFEASFQKEVKMSLLAADQVTFNKKMPSMQYAAVLHHGGDHPEVDNTA